MRFGCNWAAGESVLSAGNANEMVKEREKGREREKERACQRDTTMIYKNQSVIVN